ncbi:MAG: STAS domain-containing protein [Phycisphaeraceae bacterium]
MKITHEQYDHLTVLTLQGELNADSVDELRKNALQHLGGKTRDFVLDVSDVETVDSQGLETLLWLQEQCGEKLGQVRLAGVTANVEKILYVTRLLPRFDRHPDLESAVKSLRI